MKRYECNTYKMYEKQRTDISNTVSHIRLQWKMPDVQYNSEKRFESIVSESLPYLIFYSLKYFRSKYTQKIQVKKKGLNENVCIVEKKKTKVEFFGISF